ncbi:hypothetical protein [Bacillus toyonensis]|uniref:hypothetical protein n=1 Tax=Bacillus toyonensis TaxID=155322 RepID=UPI002714BF62|nr:hypothetical protein [Bacillus toyonensis]
MVTPIRNRTFERNRELYTQKNADELKCSAKLISGCQDNQTSADGAFNGLFTGTLLQVWKRGVFKGNYKTF